LLALVVTVYLGNTFFPRKILCFILLSSFKENKWPNGEGEIHWYNPAITKEEVEVHEEFKWLFNMYIGDEKS